MNRMRWKRSSAIVGLSILCSCFFGCYLFKTDIVKVEVTFLGSSEHPRIYRVTVTSGGEKGLGRTIESGETVSTNLSPDDMADRHLVLMYKWHDSSSEFNSGWDGPEIPRGQGYRIHVTIDARTKMITERHCFLPCNLD